MIGFGHVGQGFARLLVNKKEYLQKAHDLDVQVIGIVTRRWGALVDKTGLNLNAVLHSVSAGQGFGQSGYVVHNKSAAELIERLDFDVMTELTVTDLQSAQPASDYIRLALKNGRAVVTANKGPIALHLTELEALARRHRTVLKYEGTVLSGTPLINLVQTHLAGLEIREIQGIVNGSTNYILTRMEEGLEYDQAVAEAQKLGYLEADASADLEGWDAVAKAVILAQAVFGIKITPQNVEREGIVHLRKSDVQKVRRENKVWKLIMRISKNAQGVKVTVGPERLKDSHPLAQVKGAMNAVTISTDSLNDVTIMGPGAGGIATGFAVLNDLLAVYKQRLRIDSNQSED